MSKILYFSSPSAPSEPMSADSIRSIKPKQRAPWWIIGLLPSLVLAEAPAMRDAATHEQLALQLRKVEQADPMKALEVSKGADPAANLPKDLISESDILCFGGLATLVPKRAILMVPQDFTDRTKLKPPYRLVGWADFQAANRGWITTVEVNREQAEGKVALSDDTAAVMKKGTSLVVATFRGGPISILPLKEPAPAESPATISEKP